MKQALKPFWGVLIVFAAVAAVFVVSSLMRPDELVQWRTDFGAAKTEAAQSNRRVFAYFTANWCDACQAMKHTTWADQKVDSMLHNYVPVKIDIDQHPDLAIQYRTDEGMPLLAVLDSNGHMEKKFNGALTPDDFIEWLAGRQTSEATDLPR